MAERQVTRRWSEWCRAVAFAFIGPVAVIGCAYGVLYAVARGLAQFGFIGTALPGLSRVGVYLATMGLCTAAVAGVLMRPRDISSRGGARTDGDSGRGRVRVWGAPDDVDGAAGADGVEETVTP